MKYIYIKLKIDNTGQSILEVILAMAIFSLIVTAMVTMVTGSFTALTQGGEQTEAEALVQEAIESVRSIRDGAWNELIYTTSSISIAGNEWVFDGEGLTQTIGQYTRTIFFDDVCRDVSDDITDCPGSYTDIETKKITIEVIWDTRDGVSNTVQQISYLTNWDSQEWTQTDWSGGGGQTIWSNITKYDTEGGVAVSDIGQVTLDQTTDTSASRTWPFDTAGNYTYDSNDIEVIGSFAQLKGTTGSFGETTQDGFENSTSTSYDWPFTAAVNYSYDSADMEVLGGVARLKEVGGSSSSGDTLNNGFDSNTNSWAFSTWSSGGGDVTPTGAWVSSGGNPGGYAEIDIPFNSKNDKVGGYWEQSISVTENDATVTCSFDWNIIDWTAGNGVDDYQVYIYLDSSTGEPIIGNQIWSSGMQSGTTSWSGQQDADCSSVASTFGTYYYKIAVWLDAKNKNTGPITMGFDNSKVHWEKTAGGSYPTDEPDIYPNFSYTATGTLSWDSFTETATKNGGEIYYQLSEDNGSTWQYWNGSAWSAITTSTDYNIASVINTNISNFSTSTSKIRFRAYLESDGTQLVQIDNINIGSTPASSVWGFNTWDAGGGEVTPTGEVFAAGGNLTQYINIAVPSGSSDELGGYWVQAVTTIEANPSIDINFDYKVVDFNGTPNLAEIRVFLDTSTGDPVNQVGSAITISAEGVWTGATTITSSTFSNPAGTYYLKIAYWVETPTGGGAGPFDIGFDNVNLDWNASSYPTDFPTINNTTSLTPSAVDSWTGFIETATKNSGEIYYQLSNDDGATWQYWSGGAWTTAGASNYNTASVVNSAIGEFDTSAKKFMFKAFLESDGTQLVKLDTIQLDYNVAAVTYIGNQFAVSGVSGAGALSSSADRNSIRFTAKNSKIVDTIRIYLEVEKGTSPTYRYGLQSNGSGEPSGTWLGGTNIGYGDLASTATGWQTIALNESVALTADTVYHLVVQYQSGSVNGGNNIELRWSNLLNLLHAIDSTTDLQSEFLISNDSGLSWVAQGQQPIYMLDFSDATYEGNPYSTATENQVYGANFYGEQITVSGSDIIVSTLGMYVSENNAGPQDDLYVTLYDVTGGVVLSSTTLITAAQLTNNVYSWGTATFDSPITLSAGNTYRIFLSAPLAEVTAHFLVLSASNDVSVALSSVNYDGISSFYISSADEGASWATTAINSDLVGFRFAQTIYNTAGYVISSAYDMGLPSIAQVISWDQVNPTCTPNCQVKVQIQTAPDSGGTPGAWSATWSGPEGEDGDETDFFIINTGELIHTDHNDDQWIRYKATLVGDSTDTPTFEENRINYK